MRQYIDIIENADEEHQKTLDNTGFWGSKGVGALFISKKTGNILIVKRGRYVEQPHTWGTCGGAIDPDENIKTALKREIEEELGFRGNIDESILLYVYKNKSFRYYTYLIPVENEFTPILDTENEDFIWCSLDNLPKPLHFGLVDIFKDKNAINIIKNISNKLDEAVEYTPYKIYERLNKKRIDIDKCIKCLEKSINEFELVDDNKLDYIAIDNIYKNTNYTFDLILIIKDLRLLHNYFIDLNNIIINDIKYASNMLDKIISIYNKLSLDTISIIKDTEIHNIYQSYLLPMVKLIDAGLLEKLKTYIDLYMKYGNDRHPKYDDYEWLYHTSIYADDIMKNGFLDEKPDNRLGAGTVGNNKISVTHELKVAHDLYRSFIDLWMIAHGEIKLKDILNWVKQEPIDYEYFIKSIQLFSSRFKIINNITSPEDIAIIYGIYLNNTKVRANPVIFYIDKIIPEMKKIDKKSIGILKCYTNMEKLTISNYYPAEREFRISTENISKINRII